MVQVPPFSIRLLSGTPDPSRSPSDQLRSLLPASYLTSNHDLAIPRLDADYIEKELEIERLNIISTWLWVAGRPIPPRPLHYQFLLGREILITEQMDMHLVWTTGRLFLKPIPRFLLEPRLWHEYLSCRADCACSKNASSKDYGQDPCPQCKLRRYGLGFLFSYAALIRHESDFRIAREKHLIPSEIEWPAWRIFVEELDTEHIYDKIDERFIYGELRLSRLNKIYRFTGISHRGYMWQWHRYENLFHDNFKWLASAVVYVAVVLTAMQVGLATDALGENNAFQWASYVFTVFSIVSPLSGMAFIILLFCYIFVTNSISTVIYKRNRLGHIDRSFGAP